MEAIDFFEGHCGDCKHWLPSTTYHTKGRTCRNDKGPNIGRSMGYLDTCSCYEREQDQ